MILLSHVPEHMVQLCVDNKAEGMSPSRCRALTTDLVGLFKWNFLPSLGLAQNADANGATL